MKKRIGAVLVVLGMLLGCVSSAVSAEPESVIVQVTAGNLRGSGVVYEVNEEYLIVATAAHVLEQNADIITVTFSDDFTVTTDSYYSSSSSDLAFINVPLTSISKSNLKKYTTVQIDKAAFDAIQSGDKVIFQAMGTDTEAALDMTVTSVEGAMLLEEGKQVIDSAYTGTVLENWIYVEDFGQYMMLLQGDIEPGMSGGGVFDFNGNFLGILCGESDMGEIAAVPLSIIEAEYLGLY